MSRAKETKIESLDQLKKLSAENGLDCYIVLNHWMRSSKVVSFQDPGWWVLHMVDDTEVDYEDDEDLMLSHIGEAIKKGALYAYVYEPLSQEELDKILASWPDPEPVEQPA